MPFVPKPNHGWTRPAVLSFSPSQPTSSSVSSRPQASSPPYLSLPTTPPQLGPPRSSARLAMAGGSRWPPRRGSPTFIFFCLLAVGAVVYYADSGDGGVLGVSLSSGAGGGSGGGGRGWGMGRKGRGKVYPKASAGLLKEGSERVMNEESFTSEYGSRSGEPVIERPCSCITACKREGGRRGEGRGGRETRAHHPFPLTANLLPDINYITSFGFAGLSNQIISHFNLLHMVSLINSLPSSLHPPPNTTHSRSTHFTPLLPPFTPENSHIPPGKFGYPIAPVLRFSQVFDLDRLAAEVGWGIVEWGELKEGRTGRNGPIDVYEDEWLGEEERRVVREGYREKNDWPTAGEGRGEEPVDRMGW